MGATQLGDVVDAPEGHRELFTRGADEHDRSVTESEVVGAHREVMQLGVRRQSGVLLAVFAAVSPMNFVSTVSSLIENSGSPSLDIS